MLASRRRNGPKHEHISGSIAVPTESVYGIEITLKRKKKKTEICNGRLSPKKGIEFIIRLAALVART